PRTRHFLCRRGGGFVSDRRNEKEAISRAFAKALDRTRGFGGGGGAGRLRGGLRSQEPGRLGPGGGGEVGGRQPARPALGPGDLPPQGPRRRGRKRRGRVRDLPPARRPRSLALRREARHAAGAISARPR